MSQPPHAFLVWDRTLFQDWSGGQRKGKPQFLGYLYPIGSLTEFWRPCHALNQGHVQVWVWEVCMLVYLQYKLHGGIWPPYLRTPLPENALD